MGSVGLSSSSLASLLGSSSSSSSSSNGIDLSSLMQVASGASSAGINVTAAVNAAVTAARAPEQQWQAEQATIQGQENDLKTISASVSTLENDLSSLNSLSGAFASISATTSDSSIATASAASGVATGSHVLNVANLAATASWYSTSSVANSSTGLPAGSFTLQVGAGTPAAISVAGGETLAQLVSAINGQNLGVTAGIVNDASGSRLSIVSNASGRASNITIANTSPQLTQAADQSAWNSSPVSDSTGLLAGSFSIQVGSATATQITANPGESLNALASDINGRNLGVTASVVSDGDGSSHLAIVNSATGNASGLTITNTSPQFAQASQGKDAALTVDGIPITSASNTVRGALPGVTINLNGADPNTDVALSVTPNTSAITSAISQFVNDYNTVMGYVNSEYTYNPANSTAQPLSGDSTLSALQTSLLGCGGYTAGNNGTASTLGALGITMNNDGTLTLNSGTLNDAVQNNSSAVQQFFEGTALNGFSNALSTQLQRLTDSSDGAFTVDLKSMQSTYSDLGEQVSNFEKNYISSLQSRLTQEYDAAEIALQTLNTTKQQIDAELGNNSSSSRN